MLSVAKKDNLALTLAVYVYILPVIFAAAYAYTGGLSVTAFMLLCLLMVVPFAPSLVLTLLISSFRRQIRIDTKFYSADITQITDNSEKANERIPVRTDKTAKLSWGGTEDERREGILYFMSDKKLEKVNNNGRLDIVVLHYYAEEPQKGKDKLKIAGLSEDSLIKKYTSDGSMRIVPVTKAHSSHEDTELSDPPAERPAPPIDTTVFSEGILLKGQYTAMMVKKAAGIALWLTAGVTLPYLVFRKVAGTLLSIKFWAILFLLSLIVFGILAVNYRISIRKERVKIKIRKR